MTTATIHVYHEKKGKILYFYALHACGSVIIYKAPLGCSLSCQSPANA